MEEGKGREFCFVTVDFECVEKKTMRASNCPRGSGQGGGDSGELLSEHLRNGLENSHLWMPGLSAKHRATKQPVNEQSKKASSCLSELSPTDSGEKFNLID